ncbi:MAG: hypothetical protein QG620_586 [Patescibacteria group bacterium]|nr:hypothetical protein [Patescibacteria group bacterium]
MKIKTKFIWYSLILVCGIFSAGLAHAATEFVSVIDPGGSATSDFSSASSWESVMTNTATDLTATTATLVFSGATTGTLGNNITVYQCRGADYQSVTGTMIYDTVAGQALVKSITGGASFTIGDFWNTSSTCTGATNYFTISNTGDSAIAVAKCRTTTGAADTTAVNISGWTTSAANYIKIWTDPSENYRHQGRWDESKYWLNYTASGTYNYAIDNNEEYVWIDGLQVSISGSPGTEAMGINNGPSSNGNALISNNIVKASLLAGGVQRGISSPRTSKIWNNQTYSFEDTGFYFSGYYSATIHSYNNTAVGNGGGFYNYNSGNTVIVKNNLAYNNTDNWNYGSGGTFDGTSTNNLSGPGSDAQIPATNARNGVIVHFADEANDDFHLDSADTGARNQGIILYDAGDDANLNFTTDIDNEARRDAAGTWDIGADEAITKIYRSVAPEADGDLAAHATGATYGNVEIKPTYLAGSTTNITDYVATFWSDLPTNVGVGDALQYDDDDDGDIDASDSIVFITKRYDAAHFSVRTASGAAPASTLAPDSNWSIFRAYTSLALAEAGTENTGIDADLVNFDTFSGSKDIVTSQEQWNIACYANSSTADTAPVTISGWATSASSYMRIYTPTRTDEVGVTQRHNGVWDASKYWMDDIAYQFGLYVGVYYARVEGLQINFDNNHNSGENAVASRYIETSSDVRFSNNIIRKTAGTGSMSGLDLNATHNPGQAGKFKVYNNVIYGSFVYAGIYTSDLGTAHVYNNTVYGATTGINIGNTNHVLKNNIANGNTTDYTGTPNATSDFNISEDGTASFNATFSGTSKAVTFSDETNRDLHIGAGDSNARNAGADLTNDPYLPINSDIDSTDCPADLRGLSSQTSEVCNTRPRATSWDIGADELITKIYRSVAPEADGNMTAIDDDNTQQDTLSITTAGGAILESPLQDNVGVGDALIYDDDADNDLDASDTILFIHSRTTSQSYTVRDADGSLPDAATTDNDKWAIYRAYTSLSLAEAGTRNTAIPIAFTGGNRDIAANSEQWNIACYANGTTADTTGTSIDGWTTAQQNYIKVYTPYLTTEVGTSQRHQGKWDENKYHTLITATGNSTMGISIRDDHIRVEGMQVEMSSGAYTTCNGIYLYSVGAGEAYISSNLIKNATPSAAGIHVGDADQVIRIYNNIVYDSYNGIGFGSGTVYADNNTVYNASNRAYNIEGGTVILKNNIAYSPADGYYGTSNTASDYNISNLASDAPGANSKNETTVSFVDAANDDFHLLPTDTAARNSGVDLSQDQNLPITSDIDGQARATGWLSEPPGGSGHATDIGADEGATAIYRSIAPGMATYLDRGVDESGTDMSISGTTMTLENAAPDNVGVGDAIQYDSDGNNSIDAIAFISARASGTSYTVQSRDGGTPVAVTNDQDWQIFRAYTTLDNAEGGGENTTNIDDDVDDFDISVSRGDGKDIYASNEQWNIACYANGTTADTTQTTIQDWTTYPTNYIKIYTPVSTAEVGTSQRHMGKWDDSKYNISLSGTNWYSVIRPMDDYVKIDGIQLMNNDTGGANTVLRPESNWFEVSNSILRSPSTITSNPVIELVLMNDNSTTKIWNNIIYEGPGAGINLDYDGTGFKVYIHNNTISGVAGDGIHIADGADNVSLYMKNNLVYGTGDDYDVNNFTIKDYSNNAGEDAAFSGDANYVQITQGQNALFEDYANKDFHIKSGSQVRNAGADLTSDTYLPFTTDIDGHTRNISAHSGAWDIGADEAATAVYFSAGQNVTTHETGAGSVDVDAATKTATFTVAQTATNMGVGDVIDYDTDNKKCFITGKTSTLVWTCLSATGTAPTDSGGDVVVNSITHAFASLSLAEAGAPGASYLNTADLWTNNYQLNIPCYYDTGADTTAVTINGWTTGVPNYVKVYTPYNTTTEVNQGQRHQGRWDETKYTLSVQINNGAEDIVIDGLQIKYTLSSGSGGAVWAASGATITRGKLTVSNNLIQGNLSGTADYVWGILSDDPQQSLVVYNNIIYNWVNGSNHCYGMYTDDHSAYIYNNTVYNSYQGIRKSGGTVIVKNNIVQSFNDGYSSSEGSFDAASDYNISDLANDAPSPSYRTNQATTVTFADATNRDLHLATSDTFARNTGADLSADAYFAFTTDIDGHTRSTSTHSGAWDIGADETATPVYFSVSGGGDTSDKMTGTPTVDIASGVATFSTAQTGNIGVGDVISYGGTPSYAYITGKTSTSVWTVQSATGQSITGVDDATVNSITRVFTTLSSAEAGASGGTLLNTTDLLANNYQLNFPCYYDTGADTAAVIIDGWTTAPANYIKAYTPNNTTTEANNSQRHGGKWDEGKWMLSVATANNITLDNKEVFTQIIGLQIDSKGDGGSRDASGIYSGNGTLITNNILLYNPAASAVKDALAIFLETNAGQEVRIYNNVVYNVSGAPGTARGIGNNYGTSYFYNNTVYGFDTGINGSTTRTIRNNISLNNATADFSNASGATSDNNVSSDGTAPGTTVAKNKTGYTSYFADYANGDFHLKGKSNDLFGITGADLSTIFTTDIDDQTRNLAGVGWDVGADEGATEIYRSVGNTSADLNTGRTVTIAGTTATFSDTMANNVGVGDAIQYDSDNNATIDAIAFISGRTSSTVYTVQNQTGVAPTATGGVSVLANVYRAHLELDDWEDYLVTDVNPGISDDLDDFVLPTSQDLVTDNFIMNVPCYAAATVDDAAVIIDGWTTGAGNYIKVYTPVGTDEVGASQRHQGKWDTAKYQLTKPAWGGDNLIISDDYVRVDGLQISNGGGNMPFSLTNIIDGASDIKISNSIIKGAGGASNLQINAGEVVNIWNCIIYGTSTYGANDWIQVNNSGNTVNISNCTIVGNSNRYGVSVYAGTVNAKNVYSGGNGTADYYNSGATLNLTTSASSDLSGNEGLRSIAFSTANFIDIATGSEDLHLSTNSALKDTGTNLCPDTYLPVTTDIDGDQRVCETGKFDIGADEATGAVINIKRNVDFGRGVNLKAPVPETGTFGNVGYSTSTTDFEGGSESSRAYLGNFSLGESSVTVNSITALVQSVGGNLPTKALIYDDNGSGGNPGTLMGVSQPTNTTTTKSSVTWTFSPGVSLTTGNWWLGLVSDGTQTFRFFYESETGTEKTTDDINYDNPPSSPGIAATYTGEGMCIYANYIK